MSGSNFKATVNLYKIACYTLYIQGVHDYVEQITKNAVEFQPIEPGRRD